MHSLVLDCEYFQDEEEKREKDGRWDDGFCTVQVYPGPSVLPIVFVGGDYFFIGDVCLLSVMVWCPCLCLGNRTKKGVCADESGYADEKKDE